jgi:arylformamidase
MKTQASEWGRIFDISPKLHSGVAVFPGDEPFSRKVVMECAKGDLFTLSSINSTVHVGAHTDAPNHYDRSGQGIDERPLDFYLGKAQVVRLSGQPGERLSLKHWKDRPVLAPRVLVHTGSFSNPDQWTAEFNSFSGELIEFLAKSGVKLIGIDTPSIDPGTDKTFESHHMVYAHDMAVLEGIILEEVPEGVYSLIALPLPIQHGDASPVRAILIEMGNK